MSPVAKRRSVDRQRTESTESVTDWANRTGVIGLLPILNTEAWWENTEISPYSHNTSLTSSCLWVIWLFFQIEHEKVVDIYPKVTNCSFSSSCVHVLKYFADHHLFLAYEAGPDWRLKIKISDLPADGIYILYILSWLNLVFKFLWQRNLIQAGLSWHFDKLYSKHQCNERHLTCH